MKSHVRDETGTWAIIGLIARREVSTRVRQKSYVIGLLITLVIIGAAALLPKFLGGHQTSYNVGVTGTDAPALRSALAGLAKQQHLRIHVHDASDAAQAERLVGTGRWDAAIIDDARIVAKSADSTAAGLAQSAHTAVVTVTQLRAQGLDPGKVAAALTVAPLPLSSPAGANSAARQAVATITIVVLFAQLITFITWVAMGVVEEKTSRVVELILSTVRPWQLLAGKLLGIGSIAVGQLLLIGIVGVGVASAAGTVSLPAGVVGTIAVTVGWFVIGFAFFAALAAALGSLVSRQEEVSGVLAPVTGLLMVSYLLGLAASLSSSAAGWTRVVSVLPPVSAIAMPARMAREHVPVAQLALAVVLMAAVTVAVVGLGSKIYRAAVLHTGGGKISLRTAWRSEAAADLG
jgi:ABC-2 type transport system permease protein